MTFAELMDAFSIKKDVICNKKVYEALVCQMKDRITPVIGAGLSAWAGYPMWGALLIDKSKGTPVEGAVIAALESGRYEYAASILEEFYMPNNFLRVLTEAFSPQKLQEKDRPLYQYQLRKLFPGPVVTTNYDISLEHLFNAPFTVLPEDNFQSREIYSRIQQHRPMLVKLHGTIEDPTHLILTEERYNATYGDNPKKPDFSLALPNALKSIFQGAPPLFLGCGLRSDRTCAVLQACKGATGFALLELPEETKNDDDPMHPRLTNGSGYLPEFEVRMKQMDELNLQVIWYPYQHHEAVKVLIEQLSADLDTVMESEKLNESSLVKSVKMQKRIIQNQPLISSAPERLSFGSLFDEKEIDTGNIRLYNEQKVHMRNSLTDYNSISELFQNNRDRTLLIIGNAGAGKTTGLKSLFLSDSTNSQIFYSTVKDFEDRKGTKSEMLTYMRNIFDGLLSPTGKLLILDGLDEAFSNQLDAIACLNAIFSSKATIWVGCRSDYYDRIVESIMNPVDGVAEITAWSPEDANRFIHNYSKAVKDDNLLEKMNTLRGDSSIEDFIWSNPFFLTLFLFCVDCDGLSILPKNEYELLEVFLDNWYKAEEKRGTSRIGITEYYHQLFYVANALYHRTNRTFLSTEGLDEAVLGFLSKRRTTVRGFVHWDICVFLISKQIIDATINGGKSIIECYPNAFLNDVTDMTWSQLEVLSERVPSLLSAMNDNLFATYRQIHEPEKNYLCQDAKELLACLDDSKLLALKDEIIYFSLRLPLIDKLRFFNYASVQKDANDSIIELGLAYGIGMSMSHPFSLQFAKKLEPGEPAAILNQSWTVAFFGDQKTVDIYTFRENPTGPWKIARNARLNRFKKSTEKAYRYRLFDIPLMYCFFSSRKWACDLSEDELEIIKNCSIEWSGYSPEEHQFLAEKKRKLVDKYERDFVRSREKLSLV